VLLIIVEMAPAPEDNPLPPLLQDRFGYLLGITHGGMRTLAGTRLRDELGLEVKQFGVMTALAGLDAAPSQQELADLIRIDRTTMVAMIDSLEEAGYVARCRNPADRRQQLLELTPAGRGARERAERIAVEAEREFLSPLSAGEAKELRRLLQAVARRHGRASPPG
jgi:DNA-binding MarR family transcriptional regulator